MGIQYKLTYQWIKAFRSVRSQRVRVNGTLSEESKVTSGIPQGSVLGPVLFVIYINDLPQGLENKVKMFADDTKLYASNVNPNTYASLQRDLDKLPVWSDKWLLRFHPEKCSVLKLGSKKSDATYKMKEEKNGETKDVTLAKSDLERDLGVWVDSKLTFKEHVNIVTEKADDVLGTIRRTFEHLDGKMFVQLYKAIVRPILEYGHTAWEPQHKTQRSRIEDVQRRATRLISTISTLPYPERLRRLNLPSLEHRRLRGDMIDMFKYLNEIYDASSPVFTHADKNLGTRGNTKKLFKHHCEGKTRSNFFSERSISVWNGLPENVIEAKSVNAFKGRLDKFWQNLPSKFDPKCQQVY